MAFADIYRRQVSLLLRVLPAVAKEECFALKGGTAINLFVRDLPRLSVDIDLTYLPIEPRATSLSNIDAAMRRIAAKLRATIPKSHINEVPLEGSVTRLVVRLDGAQMQHSTGSIRVTSLMYANYLPTKVLATNSAALLLSIF